MFKNDIIRLSSFFQNINHTCINVLSDFSIFISFIIYYVWFQSIQERKKVLNIFFHTIKKN